MTDFNIGMFAQAGDDLGARISEFDGSINSPYAAKAQARVYAVRDVLRAAHNSAENYDPSVSGDANYMNAVDKVDKSVTLADTYNKELDAINSEWLLDLTRQENIACGFDRTSGDTKGIEDAFCAKPLTEKLQDLMNRWQKNPAKGGMYIGTVARMDEYRSGVSPEDVQRARDMFVSIHAPHIAQQRGSKAKIMETARTAMGLPARVKNAFVDPVRAAAFRNRKAKFTASERDFLAALAKRPDAA
ncbi:MAG: hypothetical protein GC155_06960 [Alphaproteobacteria bacterium]|nr:hypothetical protein [Alphaproteobacteria bacterium]